MNRHRTNINGVRAPERGEAASAEHTWSKSHTSATGPGAWSLTNEAWLWQVVGLRNGYQTALVMAGLTSKIHAKRLAQVLQEDAPLAAAPHNMTHHRAAVAVEESPQEVACGRRGEAISGCYEHDVRTAIGLIQG